MEFQQPKPQPFVVAHTWFTLPFLSRWVIYLEKKCYHHHSNILNPCLDEESCSMSKTMTDQTLDVKFLSP